MNGTALKPCPWCKSKAKTTDGTWIDHVWDPDANVSHGMCPACYQQKLSELPSLFSRKNPLPPEASA